jgi:uncharacterized membrane protein YsdA (DUF1294 family)
MKKPNFKRLNLYTFLSFVFIIASISIAVTKLTSLPPEYTMVAVALLFGAVGALQCVNLQKRHEQLEALKKSLAKFKLTANDD